MSKDLLVLADEYAAATATFARSLALKDGTDSMSPIAREAGDKRAVLAEALAALDTAQPAAAKELAAAATQRYIDAQKQPVQVNAMLVEALEDTAQTLAWMQHGKCRGFSDGLLTTQEALDKARAALTAAQQAQPERAPLSDAEIDRVLGTHIPGGSHARDWFLPHELPKGKENVRDVVRRMIATAHGIKQGGQK